MTDNSRSEDIDTILTQVGLHTKDINNIIMEYAFRCAFCRNAFWLIDKNTNIFYCENLGLRHGEKHPRGEDIKYWNRTHIQDFLQSTFLRVYGYYSSLGHWRHKWDVCLPDTIQPITNLIAEYAIE